MAALYHRICADLIHRICADLIHTQTLREQLAGNPDHLGNLVLVVARRVAGADRASALPRKSSPGC